MSDPDARPIRKGKLGKPGEFGYVVQVAAVTATPAAAPAAMRCQWRVRLATRASTACWTRPPSSWTASAFDHARSP